MPEESVNNLLERLSSSNPEEGWSLFLQEYSSLILQVARHLEHDADLVGDCFQFVCERLSDSSFQKLRKFRPEGPASFSTWLRAVVRNLCLDWRRKQFGRARVFKSIARLSTFDQEVFRHVYERGISFDDTFQSLRSKFPDLTLARLAESRHRIEKELTTKQRWLLGAALAQRFRETTVNSEVIESATANILDPRPSPETEAVSRERTAALRRALVRLPQRERLLMRLRFEQELTLDQIAKVLGLGNPQRVERQIKTILATLRQELE
ncbi:MAG: sigma-70 family RNA polymerase sigma factor [bacterium]